MGTYMKQEQYIYIYIYIYTRNYNKYYYKMLPVDINIKCSRTKLILDAPSLS